MNLERLTYSPINDRPKLELPNGARVALWVCPNIEHYEYLPDPVRIRDPWPRMPHPDILGYGIKDYGNRVGLWRMIDVMDHFNVRCTVSLNLGVFEHYPEIMAACEERNWDVLCHGIYNTQYLWGLGEADERAIIEDCVETYRRLTGRQLAGWFSPAASHTLNTPDLVAEAGIKYYADWFHDDQPGPMHVRHGRLLTVPYSMELNDAVLHNRAQEADDFLVMVRDYFDAIYAEGAEQPRVMCIALHPYMMGQPHRIGYLEKALDYVLSHDGVWQATGEEIADWYYSQMWDKVGAHLQAGQLRGPDHG
jgi:peptidoglycan/xylan/chitin deacetylase (PgdA/CDA1 family)